MADCASVMSLIAARSWSRDTADPAGKPGDRESAYAVIVYNFGPGPFEQGGAYASWLFTLFVPTVPGAGPPAGTEWADTGMSYTTQYQCVSPGPGMWCMARA